MARVWCVEAGSVSVKENGGRKGKEKGRVTDFIHLFIHLFILITEACVNDFFYLTIIVYRYLFIRISINVFILTTERITSIHPVHTYIHTCIYTSIHTYIHTYILPVTLTLHDIMFNGNHLCGFNAGLISGEDHIPDTDVRAKHTHGLGGVGSGAEEYVVRRQGEIVSVGGVEG